MGDVRAPLLVSQMRDEVPVVEQPAVAGFHLHERRVVLDGGVLSLPLKQSWI